MRNKTVLKQIFRLAKHQMIVKQISNFLNKYDYFSSLSSWYVDCIYYHCHIKDDGYLYTCNDVLLSKDGRCMDEYIPYFVNQSCGYCGDDFFGVMFIKVDDDNTFVSIRYEC